jgi:hypothetical protein
MSIWRWFNFSLFATCTAWKKPFLSSFQHFDSFKTTAYIHNLTTRWLCSTLWWCWMGWNMCMACSNCSNTISSTKFISSSTNLLDIRDSISGWQKLHSHAYTHVMVYSFVSSTHYLIYLRRWIAKKIRLWHCLFASFVSFSQLIIVIWIKTSVGITTVFHTGISRAVAAA